MKPNTLIEMQNIIQAKLDGEEIQCRIGSNKWKDVGHNNFNFGVSVYRIKPKLPELVWVTKYRDGELKIYETEEEALQHNETKSSYYRSKLFVEVVDE